MAKGNGSEIPRGYALPELEPQRAFNGGEEYEVVQVHSPVWWKVVARYFPGIALVRNYKDGAVASVRVKAPKEDSFH